MSLGAVYARGDLHPQEMHSCMVEVLSSRFALLHLTNVTQLPMWPSTYPEVQHLSRGVVAHDVATDGCHSRLVEGCP